MSEHLLAMAIGPVQDFIAAARRTRDLWFGSHVLSEISKAAAKAVADEVGIKSLIFPAPTSASELEPDDTLPKLAVANVILTRLPAGSDPITVANAAKRAAQNRWYQFAISARDEVASAVTLGLWESQVNDVVEFYAAWKELPSVDAYQGCRRDVMRLLVGRKACRDFVAAHGVAGVAKSSLDGARESVINLQFQKAIRNHRNLKSHLTGEQTKALRRLRLSNGEELDVVALTKRAAIQRPYPSVARIAANSWLRSVSESSASDSEVAAAFRQLCGECEKLGKDVVHQIDSQEFPQFKQFPFEGTAIYRQRHRDLAEETDVTLTELVPLADAVRNLADPRRPEGRGGFGFGEPNPYLAILVADGDRVGAAISAIKSSEDHRAFSQKLSEFAEQAKGVVRNRNGVCVYAGGDDVLALLPLDECLACGRELHTVFGGLMGGWKTTDGVSPTLSVGIAIGHFMEPLEDLLEFGREAEKVAKNKPLESDQQVERNALAVVVRTRGAAPITVRDNWFPENDEAALDQRLYRWAKLFACGSLPNKLPYDLRQLSTIYERWPSLTPNEKKTLQTVLSKDVKRLLKHKQTDLANDEDGNESKRRDRQFLKSRLDAITSVAALKSLAAELLIAQQISAALPPKPARIQQEEVVV